MNEETRSQSCKEECVERYVHRTELLILPNSWLRLQKNTQTECHELVLAAGGFLLHSGLCNIHLAEGATVENIGLEMSWLGNNREESGETLCSVKAAYAHYLRLKEQFVQILTFHHHLSLSISRTWPDVSNYLRFLIGVKHEWLYASLWSSVHLLPPGWPLLFQIKTKMDLRGWVVTTGE